MNQILDSYTNNSNKPEGTDKIVRVFAILIMIFAIALIAVVGYGMFRNNEEEKTTGQEVSKANIKTSVDGDKAIIEVTHDKDIKKLIYSWNSGTERVIKGEGKTLTEIIDIPAGTNTLEITVVDVDDGETTYNKEFSSESGLDIINPVIELSVTEDKKLRIVATDETAMDFITYRWNQDEEETIYAEEGSKEITADIEIMKGENNFTVVAVDTSTNTAQEYKSFKGLTKPEIKVTLSEDGSEINIRATHENGIKDVKFNFNNSEYNVDIGDETPTEIEFNQGLETGYNRIIVTVTSVDDTETVFDGECSYGEVTDTRSDVSDDEEDTEEDDEDSEENNDEESEDEE